MSRALERLREATGDPLLVRAGRGLVASPRALELRDSISQLVQDAEAALRCVGKLDRGQPERTLTVRASEGFVENFRASLLSRISGEAPGVSLHFLHKLDKDSRPLRDGSVDLETGVVDKAIGPEVHAQALFRDRYVGVVRAGLPLSEGDITPARFAAARHVHVSRRDGDRGPIDDALATTGLQRRIVTIVGGFSATLSLAHASNLVACGHERHSGVLYKGMHSFTLPLPQHRSRRHARQRPLHAVSLWRDRRPVGRKRLCGLHAGLGRPRPACQPGAHLLDQPEDVSDCSGVGEQPGG